MEKLMPTAIYTLKDQRELKSLESNIATLARQDASIDIVEEAYKLLK